MAQLPSGLYQVEVDGPRDHGARRRRAGAEFRPAAGRRPGGVELTPRDLTRGRIVNEGQRTGGVRRC